MTRTKDTYRKLIGEIMDKQYATYKNARTERETVRKLDWDRDDEFAVHVEIEGAVLNVRGIAGTIVTSGKVKNFDEAMHYLQYADIFHNARLAEWYFDSNENYPQLKNSIELIDYLRLLVIEYLNEFQDT